MTVLARYQSGGRGRAGRRWITAPGDALLFSLILRPSVSPDRLSPLSILVADAISDSLRRLYGLSATIKWPNDVLLDGRKISGVLIQVRDGVAVVGVGINLRGGPASLPDGATTIREHAGGGTDGDALLADLLLGIDGRYRAVLRGEAADLIGAVSDRLWLRDSLVSVGDAGRVVTGTLRGLREDGALLLETRSGTRPIVAGELVRGPRAMLP
jgi:BirA family biotin operon repressor/biotin-[acetyl-CoA-carboxylase] ligase